MNWPVGKMTPTPYITLSKTDAKTAVKSVAQLINALNVSTVQYFQSKEN